MSADPGSPAALRLGFLLVPTFAILPYAATVEPLRAANLLMRRTLFDWRHLTVDGAPIESSNGLRIEPDAGLGDALDYDVVFVFAGTGVERVEDERIIDWLRRLAARKVKLGGISGGTFLLARAGVLNGYRCTIHWDHAAALAEVFPDLDQRGTMFEVDRDRLTCSGGIAPLDLMHFLLTEWADPALAHSVSEWFLHRDARPLGTLQREGSALLERATDHRLRTAIDLMYQTLEEPVLRDAVARHAGLSARQLDRLCLRDLGVSLAQIHRLLRLKRADNLLQQTNLPVTQVAVASGFGNPSHFSRAFRREFGVSPSDRRRPKL